MKDWRARRAAQRAHWRDQRRELVTPEGIDLSFRLASRGARAGALLLDLLMVFAGLVVIAIVMGALGYGAAQVGMEVGEPALNGLMAIAIIAIFLGRFGYFLWFELGPRGATPGKRALGLRVAARPAPDGSGRRLTAEAVIARNLMRDVEVFLPAVFLLSGMFTQTGVSGAAACVWLALFALLPFTNRDRLRAGDIVAGTWVVEHARAKLAPALSVSAGERPAWRFGEAELSVYGERELTVLEGVLRQGDATALRQVADTIGRKIGWQVGEGDECAFLDAFYAALRAHLERGLRFGRRKADKFG